MVLNFVGWKVLPTMIRCFGNTAEARPEGSAVRLDKNAPLTFNTRWTPSCTRQARVW